MSEHYLAALGADGSVRCQLGHCFVSPEKALLGRNNDLDIATGFEFDLIYIRPLRFVSSDGTIEHPDKGWLPR
jgi:hypothetical protein